MSFIEIGLGLTLIAAVAACVVFYSRLNRSTEQIRELKKSKDDAHFELKAAHSEFKNLQDVLGRERDLLGTLLDNIPDQIYFKDAESRFLKVNQGVARTLGMESPEHAIGKTDYDFFRAEDAASFRADDQAVMETGRPLRDRIEHGVVKGAETWMSTTKAPMFDKQGRPAGIVGISRDITDRKRTQDMLENVVAHARCILWEARVKKNEKDEYKWTMRIHSSAEMRKEFDLDHAWTTQIEPDQLRKMEAVSSAALKGGAKDYQQEFSVFSINGEKRWLKEDVQIQPRADGEWDLFGVAVDITDRKSAEDALRGVVESAHCVLWEADVVGSNWNFKFHKSDEVWAELGLKHTPEITNKAPWISHVIPEHLLKMHANAAKALAGDLAGYQQEFAYIAQDGSMRWLTEDVKMTRVSAKHWKLVGVCTDITERKRAEQALSEERKLLRTLMDNLPDYIYLKDPQGRYLIDNAAHAKLLGVKSSEDVIGKTVFDFFPPEIASRFDKDDRALVERGEPLLNREEPSIDSLGGKRWLSTTKVPLFNDEGSISGIVGISRDVTEQKKAEERVRDVIARAECILWNAQVHDENGVLRWKLNMLSPEPLRRWLGLNMSAQSEGEVWSRQILPEHLAQMNKRSREALLSGASAYNQEFVILGVDGSPRWMAENVEVTHLSPGHWSLVGVVFDITDRKRIEEALRYSEERLRLLVQQMPAILWSTDKDLRFTSSTGAGLAALNTKPNQSVGMTLYDYFGTTDSTLLPIAAHLKALNGESSSYEFEWMDHTFHTHVEPLRNAGNEIRGSLGLALDITDRKQIQAELAKERDLLSNANEQLSKLAREDALTGLLNRRVVTEVAENEWARWLRFGKAFSVIIIDADDFKSVNDRFGHRAGDVALKLIAGRLRESIRSVDTLGRYGGEEFVIILPETTLEGATAAAEKILESVRRSPLKVDEHLLKLTVSIGIATAQSTDKDASMLIHRADMALLKAKGAGKNRVMSATG